MINDRDGERFPDGSLSRASRSGDRRGHEAQRFLSRALSSYPRFRLSARRGKELSSVTFHASFSVRTGRARASALFGKGKLVRSESTILRAGIEDDDDYDEDDGECEGESERTREREMDGICVCVASWCFSESRSGGSQRRPRNRDYERVCVCGRYAYCTYTGTERDRARARSPLEKRKEGIEKKKKSARLRLIALI